MRVQSPKVGDVVHYCVADFDGPAIGNNGTSPGVVLPAVIVKVWSDVCVQLRVFCDGPVDAWKTSVLRSDEPEPSKWSWPEQSVRLPLS